MADTSLVSLAQNVDTKEWPHSGEEEKPSKYIHFTYDELLMMPEIAGKTERIDHLIEILKETLAFDDPFGEMVEQVEISASKENPILKTLARLKIPEDYPLSFVNLSEGTRAVCASEGVKTIGEFATLGQQMSTRVILGGDFRDALNALTHGDEDGIARFLPYRKGSTGLHLAEAIGIVIAATPRADQLALAKFYGAKLPDSEAAGVTPLSRERGEQIEASLFASVKSVLDWFRDDTAALIAQLNDGGTFERYFVVINDPVREAIAARLAAKALRGTYTVKDREPAKKPGFFARLFGKR